MSVASLRNPPRLTGDCPELCRLPVSRYFRANLYSQRASPLEVAPFQSWVVCVYCMCVHTCVCACDDTAKHSITDTWWALTRVVLVLLRLHCTRFIQALICQHSVIQVPVSGLQEVSGQRRLNLSALNKVRENLVHPGDTPQMTAESNWKVWWQINNASCHCVSFMYTTIRSSSYKRS